MAKIYKIAFVWPYGYFPYYSIPLPFAALKANLRQEVEIRLFDNALTKTRHNSRDFFEQLKEFDPEIVCVSSWTSMIEESLNILRTAKSINPKVITVIGGVHATLSHLDLIKLPEVDYLFRGEAEHTFNQFIGEMNSAKPQLDSIKGLVFKNRGEIRNSEIELVQDLDSIIFPDFDFINLKEYHRRGYRLNSFKVPNAPIWVTRGCPYQCQFCSSPIINGPKLRTHSIEYVVNQIKYLKNRFSAKWFNIIDDNFTFNVGYTKDFCRAIIDSGLNDIYFGTPCGIRMQRGDPELWQLMKRAGWQHLVIAPESGSQRVLDLMKKKLDLEIVPQVVKDIKDAGLNVHAFFILGYPGERLEDLELTYQYIRKGKFDFVFLANFFPIPGTPAYIDLINQGEISAKTKVHNFTDGPRSYTPPELVNFNFSWFIIKIYLQAIIDNPRILIQFYTVAFKLHCPIVTIRGLLINLFETIKNGWKKCLHGIFYETGDHF